MRLFDIFRNITIKFKNKNNRKLPEAQYINSATVEQPIIHENAYVQAYTKNLRDYKLFTNISLEQDGQIMKFKKNEIDIQVTRINKLKESLSTEDSRKIDLYRGILEKNNKKKIVYFGLDNGIKLNELLADKNRKNKVSSKITKMFTTPITPNTTKFLGSLVEDNIYKNYCITKSPKLENYVNKIEEKRKQLIQKKKQESKV